MVNLNVSLENEKNEKVCERHRQCRRYNFGYRQDMSDIRQEVTAGHSPIINSQSTARTAFSQSGAPINEQPLENQPNVWGPMFKSREEFVAIHLC